MTISVLIPVHNGARTIKATLDSVLQQTLPPDEILVLDDGSTDETFSLLKPYAPRVTVYQQPNKGVAAARNSLCARAAGDLIALLDADDLWHPRYLENQHRRLISYPNASASFTGHLDFSGYGGYQWKSGAFDADDGTELLDPLTFSTRLDTVSGFFLPSVMCVPKRVLDEIGREAFCEKVSGVDDSYFFRCLALLGNVVISPTPLVAYRITAGTVSDNRLNSCRLLVECFNVLEERYRPRRGESLYVAFRAACALQRRQYAKRLMGAGMTHEARSQILSSFFTSRNPVSFGKSLAFLLVSYLPSSLQPRWPPPHRVWPVAEESSADLSQ